MTFFAVGGNINSIAGIMQGALKLTTQIGIIFHYQTAHPPHSSHKNMSSKLTIRPARNSDHTGQQGQAT
jgi:hypothetical protein